MTGFGAAERRLALATPRPAAGLTSDFRQVGGLRTHTGWPRTGWGRSACSAATLSHSVRNAIEADLVRVTAPGPVARAFRGLLTPGDEELTSCASETPRSGRPAAGSAAS